MVEAGGVDLGDSDAEPQASSMNGCNMKQATIESFGIDLQWCNLGDVRIESMTMEMVHSSLPSLQVDIR